MRAVALLALVLPIVFPLGAKAQVQVRQSAFGSFDAGDTCYIWQGGHGSAGAFSKCQPAINIAVLTPVAPPPVAAPMAAPVCPPQITLIPEPKRPVIKRKPRPKPVQC